MTGQTRRQNGLFPLGLALAAMFAGLLLMTSACDGSVLELSESRQGSGDLETHEYQFTDFTQVQVSSAFEVAITMSDEFTVAVTADDNVIDLVQAKMSEGVLTINLDETTRVSDVTLKATITMPSLTRINVSGAARATVSGFSSKEALALDASGASSISGDMTAGATDFKVSGASKIELQGTAAEIVANVSGASHLLLRDFVVTHANVVVSGASDATVNLTGRLDAEVSGASKLQYRGDPTMGKISTTGASSLNAE